SVATLEVLRADQAEISAVHLGAHPKLRELWLSQNHVDDLSGLAQLSALTLLYAGFNEITDLSPLAGLSALETLRVEFNAVSDLSPVASLPLVTVVAAGNMISDVTPLAGIPTLRWIDLSGNLISDISAFAAPAWTDLDCLRLDLNENPLNAEAVDVIIPALCAQGAVVSWSEQSCNDQCIPVP
ncbi:MAG: leucine-rich repeat domain-containing protein, partial [Myxococcales bacterium]|nr:leucine-rich repeat domain-containing protein [Myxococcales bacterium]